MARLSSIAMWRGRSSSGRGSPWRVARPSGGGLAAATAATASGEWGARGASTSGALESRGRAAASSARAAIRSPSSS